jgi:hypothetical protein
VLVLPVDYDASAASIDQFIASCQAEITDKTPCKVRPNGRVHEYEKEGHICRNPCFDELGDSYCAVEEIIRLRIRRHKLKCVQPMLNFYWSTKMDTDCVTFLRDQGFIHSYR